MSGQMARPIQGSMRRVIDGIDGATSSARAMDSGLVGSSWIAAESEQDDDDSSSVAGVSFSSR